MKRIVLAGVLMLASLLAACAPAAPQGAATGAENAAATGEVTTVEAAAAAEGDTLLIGYTASVTGKLNVESTRQTNGLNLWIEQVNAAGGIQLADGRALQAQAKFYDDESNNDRIQELYTKLATDDGADFLISPYSSGLTSSASVISEQNGKVMITTGAASASNYQQGYSLVYQAYTPDTNYLTGAADLLHADAPAVKRDHHDTAQRHTAPDHAAHHGGRVRRPAVLDTKREPQRRVRGGPARHADRRPHGVAHLRVPRSLGRARGNGEPLERVDRHR